MHLATAVLYHMWLLLSAELGDSSPRQSLKARLQMVELEEYCMFTKGNPALPLLQGLGPPSQQCSAQNALWGPLSCGAWSSQQHCLTHAYPLLQDLELAVREVCPALEGSGVTADELRNAGLLPALPPGPGGKLTGSLCAMRRTHLGCRAVHHPGVSHCAAIYLV